MSLFDDQLTFTLRSLHVVLRIILNVANYPKLLHISRKAQQLLVLRTLTLRCFADLEA